MVYRCAAIHSHLSGIDFPRNWDQEQITERDYLPNCWIERCYWCLPGELSAAMGCVYHSYWWATEWAALATEMTRHVQHESATHIAMRPSNVLIVQLSFFQHSKLCKNDKLQCHALERLWIHMSTRVDRTSVNQSSRDRSVFIKHSLISWVICVHILNTSSNLTILFEHCARTTFCRLISRTVRLFC